MVVTAVLADEVVLLADDTVPSGLLRLTLSNVTAPATAPVQLSKVITTLEVATGGSSSLYRAVVA